MRNKELNQNKLFSNENLLNTSMSSTTYNYLKHIRYLGTENWFEYIF